MQKVEVFRIATSSPDDVSGLKRLIDDKTIKAEEIIAILGKTEGNGCVNDYTRGFSNMALSYYLAGELNSSAEEVQKQVALIMSGGTEGVMSPHLTVFVKKEVEEESNQTGEKRLTAGIAFTRDFKPEEIGRMEQVKEVAKCVKQAMKDAHIENAEDVHFVQIKCPLLTAERMEEAESRGKEVAINDTYKSMGYSRGASALGVALALGEVTEDQLNNEMICHDYSLYSGVASTSAGVELLNDEIILIGNSTNSASDLISGHAVMKDSIDIEAVKEAMRAAGLVFEEYPSDKELGKIVNVLAKAEASSVGTCRDRRTVMLEDSDINHTRHARAVVNAVISTLTKDPMVYVSGGGEHQGPDGGGPVAVIAKA